MTKIYFFTFYSVEIVIFMCVRHLLLISAVCPLWYCVVLCDRYEPPVLAIANLYWKAWLMLLIVAAYNTSTFGKQAFLLTITHLRLVSKRFYSS